ncbi:ABC transporter ATP-binding protein [Deinococcus cavernae]|uniref:ABC transporter ATP-binding protein n=1 Tax=Deinococcus cavernae TaxID=2320857 RepID=A0A418VJ32_9DEIO|nr:ABC transporter ATP-binding protein [Deinococcus cavernae]RJF76160.1 ABC transporter ATP-binding protein [Deinococcus cavernae]
MSYLELEGLHLAYGNAPAVENLNLQAGEGELISLLGPSGCGKTTTMRAIAGLLAPRAGHIRLAGQDITHLPANRRDIGLVFQSYALFPHLTAFENVAFGLRLRRVPDASLRERVDEALRVVGLTEFAQRLPANMSGGQQQRVALARAFVIQPRLLLLDEPLSNLDAKLRVEMRSELRRLQRELGVTMLYVTHDQEEALALSDRIIVMRAGKIEQQGTPEDVYARPRTPFVADFMGWDNLLPAAQAPAAARARAPQATHFAWRPDAVHVGIGEHTGQVLARNYLGEHQEYLLGTPFGHIKAYAPVGAQWPEGHSVPFDLPAERAAPLTET